MLFKLSNLNSNLSLTLGYLNPALNNSAQGRKTATVSKGNVKKAAGLGRIALRTIPPDKAFRACRQRNGNGTETNPMTIHFQDRLQWSFVLLQR